MKRILTNSGKEIDKRNLKQRIGLKTDYKEKNLDVSSKQAVNLTFQVSLAAILKENRLSNSKLKTQRKPSRKLFGQNLKLKERQRKVFDQSSKRIKALSSERFHRYCMTTLQTQICTTKNDENYLGYSKEFCLGKPGKSNMNEIQQMKDQILYNFYHSNIPIKQQQKRQKMVVFNENTKSIPKKQAVNVLEQRTKIERIIKQKIDPITDILNRITFLASHKKVNFSHILFLTYKLFYLKRLKNTELIYKLTQQNEEGIEESQYKLENDNIHKCMMEMLDKLKKSKKWKDIQLKWIYQKQNFDQPQVKIFHKYILQRFICDYIKLAEVTDQNNQNHQIMHQFFIGFFQLYQIQQDQNIKSNSKQQYKKLKNNKINPQIGQKLIFLKEIESN